MSNIRFIQNPLSLIRQFEMIEDLRIEGHKRYLLLHILVFAFIAILSDQQSWYKIHAFYLANLGWVTSYIDTVAGVPSYDTFWRVFSLLDLRQSEEIIITWERK
ncbi:MAG: transposase family protein [Candidatus Rhabdochlamydia sp.]